MGLGALACSMRRVSVNILSPSVWGEGVLNAVPYEQVVVVWLGCQLLGLLDGGLELGAESYGHFEV